MIIKIFKKVLAFLLLISILICTVPTSLLIIAGAENAVTLSIASVIGKPGDVVKVSVELSAGSQVCGGNFNLTYDNTRLEVVNAVAGEMIVGYSPIINPLYDSNKIRLTFAGIIPITVGGNLISVNFRILEDSDADAVVSIESPKLYDEDSKEIQANLINGSVIIEAGQLNPQLTVNTVEADPGENVEIIVGLTPESNVCGGSFNLIYDADKLEVVSAAAGELTALLSTAVNPNYDVNCIRFTFAGLEEIQASGSVLSVIFKIKSNTNGVAAINIDDSRLYDYNSGFIAHSYENGKVYINGIPTPADNCVLSVQNASGKIGDTVAIAVKLSGGSNAFGGSYTIKYDRYKLELISVAAGTLVNSSVTMINPAFDTNRIRFSFAGTSPIVSAGEVALIEFKIIESASGVADISIENAKLFDYKSEEITMFSGNGFINIVNDTLKNESYEYLVINGMVSLVRYLGSQLNINIPPQIDGMPVIKIADRAFSENKEIVSLRIPGTLQSIGSDAFFNCTALSIITIDNGLQTIGDFAFENCIGLTSILIPNSVNSIGEYAFSGCTGLKNISLPNSISTIYEGTFENCPGIMSITIPNSITTIEKLAFNNCSGLEIVSIPGNVKTIGDLAFRNCVGLTRITLGNNIENLGYCVFTGCENLKSITIPKNVRQCSFESKSTFTGSYIESVDFAYGTTSIAPYMFYGCAYLKDVRIPESVRSIGDYAFFDCDSLELLDIPFGVISIGYLTFSECEILREMKLPDSITNIGYGAYANSNNIVLYCVLNSYAQEYALQNNISFFTSTHAISYTLSKQFAVYGSGSSATLTKDSIYNYNIKIFNLTTGKYLTNIKSGLSAIILSAAGISPGDTIRVELTSKTDETGIYTKTITLDTGMNATVDIVTVQKGYIKTTADLSGNISIFVYGSDGKLKDTMVNSGYTFTSKHLDPGVYKVIYIKGSSYLWQFNTIAEFAQAGLIKDEHYTEKSVTVANGIITVENNVAVPDIDEELLKYLDGSISKYTVNTTEIAAGGLLNLRLEYKFKDARVDGVSNISGTIYIPSGTTYVQNSLSVDGVISNSVTEDSTNINVALTNTSGVIRFSVRPIENMTILTSAKISFQSDGMYFSELVGTISIDVPYITISGPETTNTKQINVSGITLKNSTVAIFDGTTYIGSALSNGSGKWVASVTLNDAYDGSSHSLYAKINMGTVNERVSNKLNVYYSVGVISVVRVTMYHNGQTIEISNDNQYSAKPIITFNPGSPFTFTAEIENGSLISELYFVSTRGTDIKKMKATYNQNTGLWIASGLFDSSNSSYVHGTVSVSYKVDNSTQTYSTFYSFSQADYNDLPQCLKNAEIIINNNTFVDNVASDGEIDATIILSDANATPIGYHTERKTLPLNASHSPDQLLQQGYVFINKDDGSKAYVKCQYSDDKKSFSINAIEPDDGLSIGFFSTLDVVSLKDFLDLPDILGTIGIGLDAIEMYGNIYNMYEVKDKIMSSNLSETEKEIRLEQLQILAQRSAALSMVKMVSSFAFMSLSFICPPMGLFLVGLGMITAAVFALEGNKLEEFIDRELQRILDFNVRFAIDPSGFVYEAVQSNRLEGVRTTAYIKDDNGNSVLWDASEFDQINPLYTDSNGHYSWDVPEGLWQVKYELDGYESVFSDWLPVPPPQTEVNIGMVSYVSPTVIRVNTYASHIEIAFSKYMKVDTIAAGNIVLKDVLGNDIAYTLVPVEAEYSTNGTLLAKTYRLICEGNENSVPILILINKNVQSYAGVCMIDDYLTGLDLEIEFDDIQVASSVSFEQGTETQISVQLLPGGNPDGLTLNCISTMPDIAEVVSIGAFDESGNAIITIKGKISGEGYLKISIPNTRLKKDILISVVDSCTVCFDTNGGLGTAPNAKNGYAGSLLALPVQGDLTRQYYNFLGWSALPNATVPMMVYYFPSENATLYAVWSRVTVQLGTQSGSPAIIDQENNTIYGLQTGIDITEFENSFAMVYGDGRIVYEQSTEQFGTGTKIIIIDNQTDEVVETYIVIIFGDVNGDGSIDSIDAGIMVDYENYMIAWDPITDAAFIKAADINGDGSVDSIDAGLAVDAENYLVTIDQVRD